MRNELRRAFVSVIAHVMHTFVNILVIMMTAFVVIVGIGLMLMFLVV